jgi:GGDEF domain-containing protein
MAEKMFPLNDGHVVRTTCSIGFVCYPLLRSHPDVIPWDDVLNLVDSAMYEAKKENNAWVGYLGGKVPASAANLRTALKGSPAELAKDGILVVRHSTPAPTAENRDTPRRRIAGS